jgi:predicted dehydrogenase
MEAPRGNTELRGGVPVAKQVRVGMVGYKFMGKAHSHAYYDVARFFDLKAEPVMVAICGRDEAGVRAAAAKLGWQEYETDWRRLVARPDIDLIDVSTPNNMHAEIAIAAAEHGKHVLCEKPLAMNLEQARRMKQAVDRAGVVHMICHNYRFAPAVQFAKQLIASGEIGEIYHFRAQYLQDWIMDPEFPLVWRLQREVAGSGAHGDLAAHIIDLARFLVGEIESVPGILHTFIKQRPLDTSGEGAWGARGGGARQMGEVTVDDASLFLARFRNGALGLFEATRFAGGNRNGNRFEINGSKGSIRWDLENMNNLQVYFHGDKAGEQGFRTINCTESVHPYAGHWWPPAHILGYEHTFVHLVAELMNGIAEGRSPAPNFDDGVRNQAVLEAVEESSRTGQWVKVAEV